MMTELIYPSDGALISQFTPKQKHFMRSRNQWGDLSDRVPVGESPIDHSLPEPVRFSWRTGEEDALFTLWECKDDGTRSTILEQCGGSEAQIYNLKTGATYCWRVGQSEVRWFTTEDAVPRLLYVDGISNVRDLGGYRTDDGYRVRQGMLIRGTESDLRLSITEEGKRTMREVLGIRTELDLRYPEDVRDRTVSVLGDDVQYIHISIHAYKMLFSYGAELCRIFDVLSDARNYPVYFHCYGGADRTGLLAMLIEALLGVSEYDIRLDYEMTTCSLFGIRSYETAYMAEFLDELNRFPGDAFRDRIHSFLHCCGISDATINKVKMRLLTKGDN